MSPSQTPRRPKHRPWDGNVEQLECLGSGVSGLVFAIGKRRVAKICVGTPRSIEDIETERKIYRRFGKIRDKHDCPHILSCLETENPRGLVFERCQETLRNRIRSKSPLPLEDVAKWAKQAAEGLVFVHESGVIQGDVGCHNMLLDSNDNIKLADFAGSSIDNSDASVNYEVRSRLPGVTRPTKKSDLFALGCAFFELATGKAPYAAESYRSVQRMYKNKKFPDAVDGIPHLGPIIRKCWQLRFDSAKDVVDALDSLGLVPRSTNIQDTSASVNSTYSLATTLAASSEESLSRTEERDIRRPPKCNHDSLDRRRTFRHSTKGKAPSRRAGKSSTSKTTWLHKFVPWPQRTQNALEIRVM